MKNLFIIVFSALFMSSAGNARAAFVMKNEPPVTFTAATADTPGAKDHTVAAPPHKHKMTEGGKAMMWAAFGIFVVPMGLGAVIHGIRCFTKEHHNRAIGVLAILLGCMELSLLLIFLLVIS